MKISIFTAFSVLPDAAHRNRLWARMVWVAFILFLLQSFVALAAVFFLSYPRDIQGVEVVFDPPSEAGSEAAIRVRLHENRHGRLVRGGHIEMHLMPSEVAIALEPNEERTVWRANFRPGEAEQLRLRVHTESMAPRTYEIPLESRSSEALSEGTTIRSRRGSGGDAHLGTNEPPSIRWVRREVQTAEERAALAACELDVIAVASAGLPAHLVPNRIWLRFAGAEGRALPELAVTIRSMPRSTTPIEMTRETDLAGLVDFQLSPSQAVVLEVRYPCGEHEVVRALRIVPTWDGAAWDPNRVLWPASRTPTVELHQQRSRGTWRSHVFCDGKWVNSRLHRAQPGRSAIMIPGVAASSARGWSLCRIVHTVSTGPRGGRGMWFVVHADDMQPRDALREAVESAHGYLAQAIARHMNDEVFERMDEWEPEQVERFARFAMAALPEISHRRVVAVDDLEEQAARDAAFREEASAKARGFLLVQSLLLPIGLTIVLLGAGLRRRRRFLDALDDGEVELLAVEETSLERRERLFRIFSGVFGVMVVLSFIAAMAFLLHYTT